MIFVFGNVWDVVEQVSVFVRISADYSSAPRLDTDNTDASVSHDAC